MPKNNPTTNRRSFLKKLGLGAGASAIPVSFFEQGGALAKERNTSSKSKLKIKKGAPLTNYEYNGTYSGAHLSRLAFPIGGIGAGMFCLEGTGAFSHMSVRARPEMFRQPNMFAAIAVKGVEKGAKVLEGPVPDWKKFGGRGSGNGSHGANFGLPRCGQADFRAHFPFGHISLSDDDLPIGAKVVGWSPFVPTDEDSSSLPVGGVEYELTNKGKSTVEGVFSFHSANFMRMPDQKGTVKPMENGFVLHQEAIEDKPFFQGDFAVFATEEATVDHCWFRGGWFDPLTIVWETIKEGKVKSNDPVEEGAPGASLYIPVQLSPGESRTIKILMAWYVPESDLHFGEPMPEEGCAPGSGCCDQASDIDASLPADEDTPKKYKPWYASKFATIDEVAGFWNSNYQSLKDKSETFSSAFYASTLPAEVMEAVAANLTILKSPTVMRQRDGRMWNWEGCSDDWGCCHGSCTHVWNYAQAVPHLFPALERSLRHTELCENQSEKGHQAFRANLPISPLKHDFHSAADGQLGGIMKVYREWRISGDQAWLKRMYPLVKQSMDFCISTWDPGRKGIVEEPHHNTYDIEFWGPDGMCTSFYLGALLAMTGMGEYLGKDVSGYRNLYQKGKGFMEKELFDGEYYIQKIQWTGLKAPNPVEALSFHTQYSKEALALLEREGPKYQYGKGCLSDGILGAWIAQMCGLSHPVNDEQVASHLASVHRYNFKAELSDHVNPQRPGYALGDEGGLLLCSWPKGGKLSLPFVYSNEVWTGIEYQVASHLMLTGRVDEGLEIVRACRDRYDGRIRNPFNEYECGSWYARALSSYGMLQGLTGLRYDAVEKTLYISSKIGDFTCFLSTATGFGTVSYKNGKAHVNVAMGKIPVTNYHVS
ncbi:GH116 family glycosyl hydrolase [Echinicola rosea]|uniref:Twin-arginine translocation signal domain-containing protein n=1 Tax=Echinicola rosea TaxID=1807691 RepID=A0ABQ1UTZ2_9BACT|nr:GH116 family glycosyl hydrolase [Echinicola rosea]GGF25510.1 hypothetical protein GCM10011339_12000 [Echinicola rosea]